MKALDAGATAPPFTLKDTQGLSYELTEALKDGPVLLAFFKVSCPTSRFTLPVLERLHQAAKQNGGPRLWGVSQNDAPATREFAREYGLSFPLLLDEEGYPVSNAYGLTNVPTLFLIRPDRTIQVSSIGFVRNDVEKIAEIFSRSTGGDMEVFLPGEAIPDYKPG
ncbi:MAG TPA: TlpA disulfide reductase family protein [Candidatus Xenobia bacterium]|nr:TlpA disulfide reductase family protein [Candidatus Xenobia bacterium]